MQATLPSKTVLGPTDPMPSSSWNRRMCMSCLAASVAAMVPTSAVLSAAVA